MDKTAHLLRLAAQSDRFAGAYLAQAMEWRYDGGPGSSKVEGFMLGRYMQCALEAADLREEYLAGIRDEAYNRGFVDGGSDAEQHFQVGYYAEEYAGRDRSER